MEQYTETFNKLIQSKLAVENKYLVGGLSLCLLMYGNMAAPQLPPYLAKLFNHIVFKILIMFLILYITLKYEPSVALITAILVTVLIIALNSLNNTNERMALIASDHMDSIPMFKIQGESADPQLEGLGHHGELSEAYGGIGTDGPITGISKQEIESLYMHIDPTLYQKKAFLNNK